MSMPAGPEQFGEAASGPAAGLARGAAGETALRTDSSLAGAPAPGVAYPIQAPGAGPEPAWLNGAEGQPGGRAGRPGPDEAEEADLTRGDSAKPAGRDARRRQQEREYVRAVQRRMLEERERMGGLGGLIR
jgi:hypothetical protein